MELNHHAKILFLISNAFNGFGFGLLLFAFGVGSSVVAGTTEDGYAICIGVGLAILIVSIIGCSGAIQQNCKQLNFYGYSIAILTAAEIVHLAVIGNSPLKRAGDVLLRVYYIFMIFNVVTSIVSIVLAWTMFYRIKYAARPVAGRTGKNEHP